VFTLNAFKSFRVSLAVEVVDDPERTLKLRDLTVTFRGSLRVQTTLPDDQALPFVAPTGGLDLKGNPTVLKGAVKVTVSDPAILTLVQPDPTTPTVPGSGVVTATGPLGTAQLKFEDDGDGATPLVALVDVQVIGGATVNLAPPTFGPLRPLPVA
jgi:hypothetical protein